MSKLGIAYLIAVSGCVVRAVQWHLVLRKMKNISVQRLFCPIMIGFLWNFLMPARMGEVIRAAVVTKKDHLSFTSVVTTVALTRVLDGLVLLMLLAYTLLFSGALADVSLPEPLRMGLRLGGYSLAALCAVAILVALTLTLFESSSRRWAQRILKTLVRKTPNWRSVERISLLGLDLLDEAIRGLQVFRNLSHLFAALVTTICVWILGALTIHWVLLAFDLHLPFGASLFVLGVISIGVALPGAPGYVGQFHAACRYSLVPFAVPATQAASVATGLHLLHFSYTVVLGSLCLLMEGISWSWVRRISALDAVPEKLLGREENTPYNPIEQNRTR